MEIILVNSGLAFLEGFALILSPCILPILPVILSGSLEGGKKRPFGIILGFVVTFALFTFFSRKLVEQSGISLDLIRTLSFGLLIGFGIIMISSYLTEKFEQWTEGLASIGANQPLLNDTQGGFLSGIMFGGLVGLIWTPCAGPILAAVIVQSVLQKTTIESFLTILAFGIGAATPMLLIVLFGRRAMTKFGFFKCHATVIRKTLGWVIIISILYIMYGDRLTASLNTSLSSTVSTEQMDLKNGLRNPYPAPPLSDIQAWINTNPIALEDLKGKVVLIDFWAYSCINCIRTLPYLKDWYQKYHKDGFVIIGVHSPEFDFERDFNNVKSAVQKFGILYPVALDNQFKTWQNFNNLYWPAHYLIDKTGKVVYQHFGEGEYDTTENNIRFLLGMHTPVAAVSQNKNISFQQTPETYLGYERATAFHSPESMVQDQPNIYTFPTSLPTHAWALRGSWIITPQKIISASPNASIQLHFYAGKVYAVMGKQGNHTNTPITLKTVFNGKETTQTISQHTLYTILELKEPESGIVELTADGPGLEIYTFTFGG